MRAGAGEMHRVEAEAGADLQHAPAAQQRLVEPLVPAAQFDAERVHVLPRLDELALRHGQEAVAHVPLPHVRAGRHFTPLLAQTGQEGVEGHRGLIGAVHQAQKLPESGAPDNRAVGRPSSRPVVPARGGQVAATGGHACCRGAPRGINFAKPLGIQHMIRVVEMFLFDTCTHKCAYCHFAETGKVLDASQVKPYRDPAFIDQVVEFFNSRQRMTTNGC